MASTMAGFAWETAEYDAAVQNTLRHLQEAAACSTSASHLSETELPVAQVDAAGGAPDEPVAGEASLVWYLEKAYAVSDQIAPRVDQAMGRVDRVGLGALLACLPGQLAPLTGALNAEDLAQWLACYQAGHGPLVDIVAICRDMVFKY